MAGSGIIELYKPIIGWAITIVMASRKFSSPQMSTDERICYDLSFGSSSTCDSILGSSSLTDLTIGSLAAVLLSSFAGVVVLTTTSKMTE
jgi:hypothetical protein